ncbi:MAG: hypothetical protein AAF740_07225 [Bacteroidota bacterium]
MNLLKKFSLLAFALLIAFSFTSCGSDDDGPTTEPTLASTVAGNWSAVSLTRDGTDAGVSLGGFTLSLSVDGDNQPTTYAITYGAVVNFANNTGSWSITTSALTLNGTPIALQGTPTENSMVLTFTDPNDKTEPVYVLTLSK